MITKVCVKKCLGYDFFELRVNSTRLTLIGILFGTKVLLSLFTVFLIIFNFRKKILGSNLPL